MANGLYTTESGNYGVIPIQIKTLYTGNIENFNLLFTGNQQKIMTESANVAFTLVMNIIKSDIVEKFIKNHKYGLHVHIPLCEISKDGSSAGLAFTIALISLILNIPIKGNIAFTGEIDLFGNINKICNMEFKLYGGYKCGIKSIYVPKKNEFEVNFINDDYLLNNLKIIFVDTIFDIIQQLFKNNITDFSFF